MAPRLVLAAAFLAVRALPLSAQGLPCPEFRVNIQTIGSQTRPAVASAADGTFLVAWTTEQDVFVGDYTASGTPRGGNFRVNAYTTGSQFSPSAAFDGQGNFVVVWTSFGQDGSENGIFGQRFDPAGLRRGPEFRVNMFTTGFQSIPRVAADSAGNFVVVWSSQSGQDGSLDGIYGQRYDAGGIAQGPEFRVNTYTPGSQTYPAVSAHPDGRFVVVWHGDAQDGSGTGVFGQRFDAGGTPQGGEFPINTTTDLGQDFARVAHRPDGGFVPVWISLNQNLTYSIYGRSFDPAGVPEGPEFKINTDTGTLHDQPFITRDPNGGFVVVWNSRGQDGSGDGIVGRRLDASGAPLGAEFRVNTFTLLDQNFPQVAALPNGGFVAAWQSSEQDGSAAGVYASLDCARLYTVTPCRVADTRDPEGPSGGPPLSANTTRSFPVTGLCGIPADARAVVLNATAVNPSEAGNLRLYPAGQAAPLASALNFTAGLTRANNAIVPLGTDGQVAVQCDMAPGSSGSTNLVLDVFGYFKR